MRALCYVSVREKPLPDEKHSVLGRLTARLTAAGVAFAHTHHEAVYTSAEAAQVRGVSLHSGAKALIVKGKDGFVMVVMPADLALDSSALRKLLGSKRLRFASREEVLEITGLTPGAIPPFGSLFGLPTLCDETLADNVHINFNAGSHTDSFQLACEDYLRCEAPSLAKLAKAPS